MGEPDREQALEGTRVVLFSGLGPGPFAAMMLADFGADVVRIDRPASTGVIGTQLADDPRTRGQRSIGIDAKTNAGRELVGALLRDVDVLIEGMRPGVLERLGFAPASLWRENPRLVIGRATGWGQAGPLATAVGHDINYLAKAGALYPMGDPDRPPMVPLNLVGDFGGGGMYLAFGVLAALLQRRRTGRGQIVDAAMVDGVASLTTMIHGMLASGDWVPERGVNLLDGGAPFYRSYATADDRYMAVGAIEPGFYADLLVGLGVSEEGWVQHDRALWEQQRDRFAAVFKTRTASEWEAIFANTNACVTRVATLPEASVDPALAEREVFIESYGIRQPAPAPRLSSSPAVLRARCGIAADTEAILGEMGRDEELIRELFTSGVVF